MFSCINLTDSSPTTALPTYTGAASTFSGSYAVAGLAAAAAIILA